jgi:hypothetical protein
MLLSDAGLGTKVETDLSPLSASASSQSVIALEPLLKGRIQVEGHGAREPIDRGTNDHALRANRRLQVNIDK